MNKKRICIYFSLKDRKFEKSFYKIIKIKLQERTSQRYPTERDI